jgi:hypothetical protein
MFTNKSLRGRYALTLSPILVKHGVVSKAFSLPKSYLLSMVRTLRMVGIEFHYQMAILRYPIGVFVSASEPVDCHSNHPIGSGPAGVPAFGSYSYSTVIVRYPIGSRPVGVTSTQLWINSAYSRHRKYVYLHAIRLDQRQVQVGEAAANVISTCTSVVSSSIVWGGIHTFFLSVSHWASRQTMIVSGVWYSVALQMAL